MRVFLTDFGLAKSFATGSRLTRSGEALGTPAYMSPEQARGEVGELRPATDVWALGCLAHELLTGRPPFTDDSVAALVGRILKEDPPPVSRFVAGLPRGASAIVSRCLAKAPEARYPDARALRVECQRLLLGQRVRRGGRTRWVGVATGLMLAGSFAAAIGLLWWSRRPSRVDAASTTAAPSVESSLAQARRLRSSDPASAVAVLERILQVAPDRHDVRIELGLLRWSQGANDEALAAWRAVPAGVPEHAAASLYAGLEAFARLDGTQARAPLAAAAKDTGRIAQVARGALAVLDSDWAVARETLAPLSGWEAALLRGYVAAQCPPGDAREAERNYSEALADGIPFAWVHYNRANCRRDLGDVRGALQDYDVVARLWPEFVGTYLNRGTLRLGQGDVAGTVADADVAIARMPDLAAGYALRANAHRQGGNTAAARADYDAALARDPRLAAAWNGRALVRADGGDWEGALADHTEALRLDPNHFEALVSRAVAWQRLGRYSESIIDSDVAIGLRPEVAAPWINRASARLAAGDPVGALADAQQALALEPECVPALLTRGSARERTGDAAGALRDYGQILQLDARNAQAWAARAGVRAAAGDRPAALADYDRAIELDPAFAEARYNRGNLRIAMGDRVGGIADYEAAVQARPAFFEALGSLGRQRQLDGDLPGALALYRRARAARPDHPRIALLDRWQQEVESALQPR